MLGKLVRRRALVTALGGVVAGLMLAAGAARAQPVSPWQGWYTGLYLGGAWTQGAYAMPPQQISLTTSAVIGGGMLGFNQHLTDTVIAGVEADFGFSGLSTSYYRCALIGRLGTLLRPTILLYGLAGPACGRTTAEATASNSVMTVVFNEDESTSIVTTTTTAQDSISHHLWGVTFGLGIESMDQWFSLPVRWGLEYRFTRFGTWSFTLLNQDFSVDSDVHDIRFRVVYPLN